MDRPSIGLMKEVLDAGPEFESGSIDLKERRVYLRKTDRVAFVMINAAMQEYPEITNGGMLEALMDAIWWVKDVAIAKYKPNAKAESARLE